QPQARAEHAVCAVVRRTGGAGGRGAGGRGVAPGQREPDGAGGGNRTRTSSRTSDFESDASTSSTTPAEGGSGACPVGHYRQSAVPSQTARKQARPAHVHPRGRDRRPDYNAGSMPLTLSDFDFALPPELVAQRPAPSRSASRLLHLRRDAAGRPRLDDRVFGELPALLRRGDLLVFNDSRVIPARMHGHKASGGKVELLVERILGAREAVVQLRASKPPRPGSELVF